ncbi:MULTISPECIES: flagellar hook-associated protein FlgK [Massilia]|uniref:Flagellar hook-associated protein 1 n=1 Tax=Massilia aurea TaxID=373040 RepID=A0A422QR88_9BURK|nr:MULTISPECIES: flagellar hook-associated protein FlgK [Massilia]MDY0962516.1 flagellar hook-associated protein FlgK [Massilia sp. CFBP9026]RNF32530.1 flagellar hook protein FlgK [Massilia aurea]
MSSLLAIGKTGLYAAQAALSTTGHNITNANVAGYSRQVVVQATAAALNTGVGFMGTGTQISQIKRYSDDFLNTQVRTAQAGTSGLESYYSQIKQIDNLLADTTSGLTPATQGFFKGIQDMAANRASVPSRQAMLSSAETLATRLNDLDARLGQIREGVNSEIESSVTAINTYAKQIAKLNDQIGNYASSDQRPPNDLLDQRDQLVLELNKYVKADARPGDNNSLTVSIGNGQPLVVGQDSFQLAAMASPTDLSRLEVGYLVGGKVSVLPDGALPGGKLGGALDFRSTTLDKAQSQLGKIAVGLAFEFNQQHELGLDQNGQPGKPFFNIAPGFVGASINNAKGTAADPAAAVTAKIVDPSKLSDNDYEVKFNDGEYHVVSLPSRQAVGSVEPDADGNATLVVNGVELSFSERPRQGDTFLVRPTINGASDFKVLINDVSQIAAAAPILGGDLPTNTGTGKISETKVDSEFLDTPPALPITLTFNKGTPAAPPAPATPDTLTGFPAGETIYKVDAKGNKTEITGPVEFENGATYSFGGISVTMTGAPNGGDQFTISDNSSGVGDTRNIAALGELQTKNIFNGGTATLQSSYAQMVSEVGNKTREVQINAAAGNAQLAQAQGAQADVSGVNLDEEATNLIKYQQAYQAASKVMQIAGTIFDSLLSISR